jgi:hypothetical protein
MRRQNPLLDKIMPNVDVSTLQAVTPPIQAPDSVPGLFDNLVLCASGPKKTLFATGAALFPDPLGATGTGRGQCFNASSSFPALSLRKNTSLPTTKTRAQTKPSRIRSF